jgi:hypothetical protein
VRKTAAARIVAALALWSGVAEGQGVADPPRTDASAVLEYAGKPLTVPFTCTDDDISFAGMACTEEEPCPVYLELTSVERLNNRLLVVGNLHSSNVTLYSVLLLSNDGGKTWREPVDRLRGAALDQIRFYGFDQGWISGQFMQPLPRDPFFLVTRDGGQSWRRRPVYDDERPGTILQFWFDSAKDGAMLMDRGQSTDGMRYEYYETPNGGETWMVRESSDKPIRRKRPSPPPAVEVIRVRADEKLKAYVVEEQKGGQWAVAASFLIEVASCRPAVKDLEEPPPPPATETAEPATAPGGVLVIPSEPEKRRRPRR